MKSAAKAIVLLLLAASTVAVAAMIRGAGKFEWNEFYVWVLGPYVVLGLVFCFPLGQSRARLVAGSVAAGVILAFTSLFYIDAMWFSTSSTSALIFLFAPAYLFVGGLIVWAVTWWLVARRTTVK